MREFLTADDICNQISMNRSVFDGTILVLEGESDMRLYDKFIDEGVKAIPAHSKDNVRKTVSKMLARNDKSILGIVDRDLDDLIGKMVSPPLFYTDRRDLEMMLFNDEVIGSIVSEYGDSDKVEKFEKQNGSIIDAVESGAYDMGLLMYVSVVRRYNLNFKDLYFADFIDKRNLSCDRNKMVKAVLDNTAYSDVNPKQIVKDMVQFDKDIEDRRMMPRGHDSVKILLIGLRDIFGSYNARSLTEGALGGSMRLAFSKEDFLLTQVYEETDGWARKQGLALWNIIQNRSLPL